MVVPANSNEIDARRFLLHAVAYAVLFAVAIAPSAAVLEFCRTPENLVIAAALEMRRDGHWLLPTLEGEPRTVKPPLATWITAMTIRSTTLNEMGAVDPAIRGRAYKKLAWDTRWPAVLIAAVTLLATAELGRVLLESNSSGLTSMLLCGSGFLFLRFASEAATDTSLMLWVCVTNVFLAHAILKGQRWLGCIGAGVALGLAMMSKGPVSLVQSVVPMLAFVIWRRPTFDSLSRYFGPAAAGLGCMLLIALPWPLIILLRNPSHQLHEWLQQMSGQDDPKRGDPVWNYLLRMPAAMTPSIVLLIAGLIGGLRRRGSGMILAIMMLIVPIAVMTLFKDRKDRYLLPMMPAAAVVCAIVLQVGPSRVWVTWWHWALTAILALGLPILGATRWLRGVDGRAWFTPTFAICAFGIMTLLIVATILLHRSIAVGTFAVMLAVQFVFMVGYRRSEGGQSDMFRLANVIWAAAPDAEMLNGQPIDIRASVDLSIYMNRITRWVPPAQWRTLLPGSRPRVVILLQHENESPPTAAGWSTLASVARGKERWWALLLPRA